MTGEREGGGVRVNNNLKFVDVINGRPLKLIDLTKTIFVKRIKTYLNTFFLLELFCELNANEKEGRKDYCLRLERMFASRV